MCLKTALKASALCSIPGLLGFGAGVLSVEQPKVFAYGLLLALAGGGYALLRGATRSSRGAKAYDVEQVFVVAGAFLAIEFIVALWSGIAFSAGFGILRAGAIVAVSMALLAAFCLTFLRRVIAGDVKWLTRIVRAVLPDADATNDGEVATRH